MESLLQAPSPAVITVYGPDGAAIVSPVWFRVHDGWFEVVMAVTDRKLAHLQCDPRCVLLHVLGSGSRSTQWPGSDPLGRILPRSRGRTISGRSRASASWRSNSASTVGTSAAV